MSDGIIVVETRVDTKGAEKGVKDLNKNLQKLGKDGVPPLDNTSDSMDNFGNHTNRTDGIMQKLATKSLQLLKKGMIATGTAMAVASTKSIMLASDLAEVQNVVDVTFGDNASAINDWAKNAATSFGLSELQAKNFNGTIGAMFKSMGLGSKDVLEMSKGITGLSGDFASFYNLKPEEAFEKLRSGISGEVEPLRQLGINMSVANLEAYALSQGITKQYSEMTEAEKATLRYNYLMSVSADAQGDFARTSDSFANQLRIAKLNVTDLGATIGSALIPMVQNGVKTLNSAVSDMKKAFIEGGFTGLAEKIGEMIPNLIASVLTSLPKFVEVGLQLTNSIRTGMVSALPNLITSGFSCILALINTFITNLPQMISIGMDVIVSLVNGILQSIPILIAQVPRIITNIVNTLSIGLPQILSKGQEILTNLINGIVQTIPQLISMLPTIINTIVNFISNNLPQIIEMGIQILISLINGIIQAIPQLVSQIPTIITSIVNAITNNLPRILQSGVQIIISLAKGLIQAIPNIVSQIPTIIHAIWNAFTSVNWWELGKNIISGIASGISGAVKNLVGSVIEACHSLTDSVKSFFGIHSPSRLMRDEIGKNIMKGIGVGIEKESPRLNVTMLDNIEGVYSNLRMMVDDETAKVSTFATNNYSNATYHTTNNDNGVIQNVTIVSPERTPSENARALRKVGRELAFG